MRRIHDSVCSRFTGAVAEVIEIRETGMFAGKIRIRYQDGRTFFENPDHVVDSTFAPEIKAANRQKRSPCIDEAATALDRVEDFDEPIFVGFGDE